MRFTQTQLLSRLAIEALNAEFAYRIDHDLSETVADLFLEDGSYGIVGAGRSHGREAIREAYRLRKARGPRTARHIFTNLRLQFDSESRARGTTIMLLFAEDGPPPHPAEPLEVSDFEDIYVRNDDGEWQYASRSACIFFRHPAGRGGVLPLGTGRPA